MAKTPTFKPGIEQLEKRDLNAVYDITAMAGTQIINGTADDDQFSVNGDAAAPALVSITTHSGNPNNDGNNSVTVNGNTEVRISSGKNDDTITVNDGSATIQDMGGKLFINVSKFDVTPTYTAPEDQWLNSFYTSDTKREVYDGNNLPVTTSETAPTRAAVQIASEFPPMGNKSMAAGSRMTFTIDDPNVDPKKVEIHVHDDAPRKFNNGSYTALLGGNRRIEVVYKDENDVQHNAAISHGFTVYVNPPQIISLHPYTILPGSTTYAQPPAAFGLDAVNIEQVQPDGSKKLIFENGQRVRERSDVNNDKSVDAQDVLLAIDKFNREGVKDIDPNAADAFFDVNSDKKFDVQDLAYIVHDISKANAPLVTPQTPADVAITQIAGKTYPSDSGQNLTAATQDAAATDAALASLAEDPLASRRKKHDRINTAVNPAQLGV